MVDDKKADNWKGCKKTERGLNVPGPVRSGQGQFITATQRDQIIVTVSKPIQFTAVAN